MSELWLCSPIRRGKLNSLFIVTARMDFQIFSKFSDFIFNTVNILWHSEPHPPISLIRGRGLGNLEVRAYLSTTLLVWNMKNDRPPACKIEIFVTINCEFSLSHLNAPLTYLVGGRHKEETLIFELELEGINITHVHCIFCFYCIYCILCFCITISMVILLYYS